MLGFVHNFWASLRFTLTTSREGFYMDVSIVIGITVAMLVGFYIYLYGRLVYFTHINKRLTLWDTTKSAIEKTIKNSFYGLHWGCFEIIACYSMIALACSVTQLTVILCLTVAILSVIWIAAIVTYVFRNNPEDII